MKGSENQVMLTFCLRVTPIVCRRFQYLEMGKWKWVQQKVMDKIFNRNYVTVIMIINFIKLKVPVNHSLDLSALVVLKNICNLSSQLDLFGLKLSLLPTLPLSYHFVTSPPTPRLNEKTDSGKSHLQDLARWWTHVQAILNQKNLTGLAGGVREGQNRSKFCPE